MAKKKVHKKSLPQKGSKYKSFYPAYKAHPVMHIISAIVILVLIGLIISYIRTLSFLQMHQVYP